MNEILKIVDLRRLLVVGTLLCWCVFMIAVRIERTGSGYYRFLIGNLFLASVPLLLSTVLIFAERRRSHWTMKSVVFVLWLLFLPNAPYILTDILHLTRANEAPAWYDLALLLSCVGTGLLIGYLSLIDVQSIVARRFSSVVGWMFALVSLMLSGFAIYLGRFLRWNSWDVLIMPTRLFDIAGGLLHPFSNTRAFSVTLVFGLILALGYVSLRMLLGHPGSHTVPQAQRPDATVNPL
jgi:uncharacterized membrane protein